MFMGHEISRDKMYPREVERNTDEVDLCFVSFVSARGVVISNIDGGISHSASCHDSPWNIPKGLQRVTQIINNSIQ